MYKMKKSKYPHMMGPTKRLDPKFEFSNFSSTLFFIPRMMKLRLRLLHSISRGIAYEWWLNLNLDILDGLVEEIYSWEEFTSKLLEFFYDGSNEDYFCTLKNLKQEHSIKEYNKKFFKASLLVRNLGFPRKNTMFMDGLKEQIKEDVRVLKLKTSSCPLEWPPHMNKSVDDKPKLSNNELAVLQCQDLYFRGKEKWKPSHKCANTKQINLIKIVNEEEDEGVNEANKEDQGDETINDEGELTSLHTDPYTSLSAITGLVQPQTIMVRAHIKRYALMELINLGSTHSFIDLGIVERLNLHVESITAFKIQVVGSTQIMCLRLCKQVPIQGVDVVIGSQWLGTLGELS
eukprot:Gb_11289 [translate_table: standard]